MLPSLAVGFIEQAVNSGEARAFIKSRIRTTAGQAGISGADLKVMPVPMWGFQEPRIMAEMLDVQRTCIDATETEITTALAKIAALRQAILKKALSGTLVAQGPADEPAAALLARIRTEVSAPPSRRKKARASPVSPSSRRSGISAPPCGMTGWAMAITLNISPV